MACGRTLQGAKPPKGQELEDHYCKHLLTSPLSGSVGSLDKRVLAYLADCEWALWRLGVPMVTRHYEVAPAQYEMAPIFEATGVACDHNMLMMDVLRSRQFRLASNHTREIAIEHQFACLLHEKPFAGINGSGKHNNWSMSTNTGKNLTDPGNTPQENARFMVILAVLSRALKVHGDVLRVGMATTGNDHRLVNLKPTMG